MSDSPPPSDLTDLIARSRAADGSPPFSDGALVELAHGERELVRVGAATALASSTSAEFVVDPDARRRGHGTAMLDTLLSTGHTLFWAHGSHPGASALATRRGLVATRTLLHLELTGGLSSAQRVSIPVARSGVSIRATPYSTGEAAPYSTGDAEDLLALNALAFAHHPEQGSLTRTDLDTVMAEPWFDPDDLILLRRDSELVGFCWLKVEGNEGEFYVVAVHPDRQGEGLGRELMGLGFARLRSKGIRTAHLYVEGDNTAALALYRSLGFTDRAVDVQYTAGEPR